MTLVREEGPATPAYFGDAALALDRAQYASNDGPCLTTLRTGEIVASTRSRRIPTLARVRRPSRRTRDTELALAASRGPRQAVGALNLYAGEPIAFTEEAVAVAEAFAARSRGRHRQRRGLLADLRVDAESRAALENRDRIGQAKGILSTTARITGDEAFDLLRRTSQNLNVKLRQIADHVVWTGQLPASADDLTSYAADGHEETSGLGARREAGAGDGNGQRASGVHARRGPGDDERRRS